LRLAFPRRAQKLYYHALSTMSSRFIFLIKPLSAYILYTKKPGFDNARFYRF